MKLFLETFFRLKDRLDQLLERDGSRVRLIFWRNKVAHTIFFIDNHLFRIIFFIGVGLFLFLASYFLFWRAPSPFPDHALVSVERGTSLGEIAKSFEQNNVVRSAFWLKVFIIFWGGEKRVVAGDYYFPEPESVFRVATMLHRGQFGLIPIRVTLHEGLSSYEIGELLAKELPAFEQQEFGQKVADGGFEGYLFPDTYFFMPNTKADDVILMMRENFARQIKEYEADIEKSKRSLSDIIIMASIIEDEANATLDSKRIVSGILWKRLSIKMPLQVDAPFKYHNGKNSYTLSKDDLKEDHPYNTYINKGLPPTAINNPGIDSIRAAIAPTQTNYLYFLSDKSSNMYYAKDFDGHQSNRELYLR